ncbi:energy-coupling factor transporter transmembrane component T [Paenibacillus sp. TAB 01]|uniref:energy-coupling factor transporter transmembrane component T n=1 Tax=Paenibacillus sp. TAB 01 TaxID=3368988 RepID=UPI0037503EC2
MPEWLLKSENYVPQSDTDTFTNKTIHAFLSVLSRIRNQSGYNQDKFHVNAFCKVACTFMLLILLSLSRSFTFVVIMNVYLFLILSMMQAKEILKILKVSVLMAIFSFIILLPSAFMGNTYSSIMIPTKVFASVMAVNILSHSTRWNSITSALKRFYVPDIFIFALDITLKYIVLLGDIAINMLYSLKLRSVGRNTNKYASLSGIAGTMFLKSKEMSEEMHSAMRCRGFTGDYQIYNKLKFTWADFIFIIVNIGILLIFVYLGRV